MGFSNKLRNTFGSIPTDTVPESTCSMEDSKRLRGSKSDLTVPEANPDEGMADGATKVEAIQAVWGKYGRYFVYVGLAMIMLTYEIDNTTIYTYQSYAISSYEKVSSVATLETAGVVLWAVVKPFFAKVSDVIGRGETYCFTISCYVLAYILIASSTGFNTYAAGHVLRNIGQSGTNIMNDIILSDISSMKWRVFAINMSFFPFLIIPWVSAFIVESVINGIGWRWGVGMLAIMMPIAASLTIGTLLFYQRRAKKNSIVLKQKMTIGKFVSLIDLGGLLLLCVGCAAFFLPFTLAGKATHKWSTPYVIALIIVGAFILIALIPYEAYIAKHPLMPLRYFRIPAIVLSFLIGAFDTAGFSATHTYLFTWATVARDFGPRDATFLNYTNGIWQCVIGIISGLIIYRTRHFKWLAVIGAVIRFVGYGVMIRFRGAENSIAELFVVQSIQGIGSGFIESILILAVQMNVSHSEMAQATSLFLLFAYLGSTVGAAVAGGVYTNTFKGALHKHLGPLATEELINTVFDSITDGIPPEGTAERSAINYAYSDVLRNITYAALGTSVVILVLTLLLPNICIPEGHNLVAQNLETFELQKKDENQDVESVDDNSNWR